MGYRADRSAYMIVAYVRRNRTLCKKFRIYRIASGVIGTDSGDCQLAGFPADLGGFDAVGHRKSGIRHSLMDSGHDLPPDALVE